MGAWGTGYFEEDYALDFMADLEDSDDPKQTMREAFETVLASEYLDMDDATAAIVSATYVDRQLNNTRFSAPETGDGYTVDTFPDRHPDIDLAELRELAVESLRRVLADESELAELWDESGEGETWRAGIEALVGRLDR